MAERSIEEIMNDLAVSSRNHALEAAAKVAKLYGAPDEACERILMLKGETKASPSPLTKEQAEELTRRAT